MAKTALAPTNQNRLEAITSGCAIMWHALERASAELSFTAKNLALA